MEIIVFYSEMPEKQALFDARVVKFLLPFIGNLRQRKERCKPKEQVDSFAPI